MYPVFLIAQQEFILFRRNRWIISFTTLFSIVAIVIAWFGMVTSGYSGFQDFTRTAASIINLCGFILPLFALILGIYSFQTNREYLELLVSQPVSRSKILIGKYIGLVSVVCGSTLFGLGLAGIIIALNIGTEGALSYAIVILNSLLLGIVFCSISFMIVLFVQRRQIALGIAFAVWLFYELIYGLIILGSTLYLEPATLKTFLLAGLLGNPIDISRVLSLLSVGGAQLFGPAGATLVKTTGSQTIASLYGFIALFLWIVIPIAIANRLFSRQDI